MNKRVAVVGCGRMGSYLAEKLSEDFELTVVDKNIKVATRISKALDCLGSDNYDVLNISEIIILALPSEYMENALKEITPKLVGGKLLINIATTFPKNEFDNLVKGEKLKSISAKIIGHAAEMKLGEKPLIVIDETKDKDVKLTAAQLFSKIGSIVFGDPEIVPEINTLCSGEGVKTALKIQDMLEKKNIPQQYIDFAIKIVAAGTMKAFTEGNLGPFVQKIIEEYKKESNQE